MTRILLIETLSNFRTTYTCIMYVLGCYKFKCFVYPAYLSCVLGCYKFKCFVYPAYLSCVLHSVDICTVAIKIYEICKLFQPIKLQIFCILTIISDTVSNVLIHLKRVLRKMTVLFRASYSIIICHCRLMVLNELLNHLERFFLTA